MMTLDLVEIVDGIIFARWVKADGTYHRTSYEPGDPIPPEVAAFPRLGIEREG